MNRPTLGHAALVVASTAVLATLAPGEAIACGVPACFPPIVAPQESASVAANAPALVFQVPVVNGIPELPPDGGLRLLAANGDELPVNVEEEELTGRLIVTPAAALEPGATYQLAYLNPCTGPYGNPSEDGGSPAFSTFHTTATAPAPSEIGTLEVVSVEERIERIATECGRCYREVQAAVATLRLHAHKSLVPFLAVTRFRLLVDGELWAQTPYGVAYDAVLGDAGATAGAWYSYGPGDRKVLVPDWYAESIRVDQVYARCHRHTASTEADGLRPGSHSLVLLAIVAGPTAWTLESDPVVVDLQCPAAGTSETPSDLCAWNSPTTDAGTPDAGSDGGPAMEPPQSCGCTLAGGSGLWVMLLIAVPFTRRRQAAASSRS